jgi:hypothetical protein
MAATVATFTKDVKVAMVAIMEKPRRRRLHLDVPSGKEHLLKEAAKRAIDLDLSLSAWVISLIEAALAAPPAGKRKAGI